MFRRILAPLAIASAVAFAAIAAPASTVVERIVAVVGEQPILQSEIEHRARPSRLRIRARAAEQKWPESEIKVQEGVMYKELLSNMVKERLVTMAADKLGVTVSGKEVEDHIKLKAADLKMQFNEVIQEANNMGLSEIDFREEVRRELLFNKMIETRVRARTRVTEDDITEYYRKIQMQERAQQQYRASIITLELPSGTEGEARRDFADALVKSLRAGADFADAAHKYSIDLSRDKGGDLGMRASGGFGKGIDEAILRLDVGQVSEPLIYGTKLMIVKVTFRPQSQIPPLSEVHDVVASKVREAEFQKQLNLWFDELKQGVYIDIRL